jgi:hypothetical protein
LRFVRVKPDVAKGTSLAQEVPALIQIDLDFRKPLTIGFGVCPLLVQSVFLCDKVLNMIEDRLIFDLILHESLLPRGCDRNGQAAVLPTQNCGQPMLLMTRWETTWATLH